MFILANGRLFTILTVSLRSANSTDTLHDGAPLASTEGTIVSSRMPVALNLTRYVAVVDGHVHLPCQVVRKVELIGRITHGELVQPAVAEENSDKRGHDLE